VANLLAMRRSLLLAVPAFCLAVSTAASAAPKTAGGTYAVRAPLPFPMTTTVPGMYGCIDGPEGVSKVTKTVTLPADGSLTVEVSYSGDWDLYVLDPKGKMIGAAETTETGNTGPAKEKAVVKKAKKGTVDIVACNWSGLPDATVKWVLTYGK
jgi:hypothetical protein